MSVEKIKINSKNLRGTLEQSLTNQITQALNDDDQTVIKFHGIYQQDDRDRREIRAQKKLEKDYSFMLRLRISGGKISASHWLLIDNLADKNANRKIKITTRQTIQLHGIIKSKLKPTLQDFMKNNLDSIAACGDVNRNIMSSAVIEKNHSYLQVNEIAKEMSLHLLPKTKAYHEVWLDGEKISPENEIDELYGQTYLPRKFKIALAIPPYNDVDVFSQDIGFIAIIDDQKLLGFNVVVGGGMGSTHGNHQTYPRLGDLTGFISVDQVLKTAYTIITIQRDFGNRQERKNSRFKYTIAKYGLEWFKQEFAKRAGFEFQSPHKFNFEKRGDNYGWDQDYQGKWHLTIFVENGRVYDDEKMQLKKALREIAQNNLGNFRCTNNQNIIISDVEKNHKKNLEKILKKYQVNIANYSPIRLDSLACVALNTCSLALAEGQRYLPILITKIELILKKYNLSNEPISIRMTGCPNGCARPFLAEIGLVGKSLGKYNLYLAGDRLGLRLNRLYKEDLQEEQILYELDNFFNKYSQSKKPDDNFGDFILREVYGQ